MRNLALIGAGYWGKNLARNFDRLDALAMVCDSSPEILAEQKALYPGIRVTQSLDDVFQSPEIKRVAIATPGAMHYELALPALKSGKDVFVEKPLALDVRHGQELRDLASRAGLILMVGHLLQYHPCFLTMRSMVRDEKLGKLQYLTSNRLNLGKIRCEENALWSFAPHDLSVIISLVGNRLPVAVRCMGESFLSPGVADVTLTAMRFDSGVNAHVFVSWINPFKEQKLTVVGSQGMIVFDDTKPWKEKLMLYRQPLLWDNAKGPLVSKANGEAVIVEESEPLKNECEHFINCCDKRLAPRTDADEGIRVLRVLQAAQLSLDAWGHLQHSDSDLLKEKDLPPLR